MWMNGKMISFIHKKMERKKFFFTKITTVLKKKVVWWKLNISTVALWSNYKFYLHIDMNQWQFNWKFSREIFSPLFSVLWEILKFVRWIFNSIFHTFQFFGEIWEEIFARSHWKLDSFMLWNENEDYSPLFASLSTKIHKKFRNYLSSTTINFIFHDYENSREFLLISLKSPCNYLWHEILLNT